MLTKYRCWMLIALLMLCHILFAQGQICSDSNFTFVEPHIAVNPTNPNNLVGAVITNGVLPGNTEATNHIGVFYSTDEGQNWICNNNLTGPGAGDPVVQFDLDGNVYLLYQKIDISGQYIRKSTNGGVSWNDSVIVAEVNPPSRVDRPWMAISPSRNDSGYFNIYVSFTHEPVSGNQAVRLYRSSDGGQNFTQIRQIFPGPDHQFTGTTIGVAPGIAFVILQPGQTFI